MGKYGQSTIFAFAAAHYGVAVANRVLTVTTTTVTPFGGNRS